MAFASRRAELNPEQASADMLHELLRSRWEIEKRLLWVRDVVMGEDRARTASGLLAISVVRNAVVNFLRITGAEKRDRGLRAHDLQLNHLLAKTTLTQSQRRPS